MQGAMGACSHEQPWDQPWNIVEPGLPNYSSGVRLASSPRVHRQYPKTEAVMQARQPADVSDPIQPMQACLKHSSLRLSARRAVPGAYVSSLVE